jgi:hypothetical protein
MIKRRAGKWQIKVAVKSARAHSQILAIISEWTSFRGAASLPQRITANAHCTRKQIGMSSDGGWPQSSMQSLTQTTRAIPSPGLYSLIGALIKLLIYLDGNGRGHIQNSRAHFGGELEQSDNP